MVPVVVAAAVVVCPYALAMAKVTLLYYCFIHFACLIANKQTVEEAQHET